MLGRGLGHCSLWLLLCLSLWCLDLLSSHGPFQRISSLLLALGLIGPDGLLGLGGPLCHTSSLLGGLGHFDGLMLLGLLGIDLRDNLGESRGVLTLRVLQGILLNNTLKGGLNAGVNHLLGLDGFRDLGLDGLGSCGGCNSIVSYGTDYLLSLSGFRSLGLRGFHPLWGVGSLLGLGSLGGLGDPLVINIVDGLQ
jgi:hypothetical protein